MRGLEITLFLLCIIFALTLVALLAPGYNNGGGISTGSNDFGGQNAFNWSSLNKYNATNQNSSIIDQAAYWFDFARMAITGIATILFSALWAAPALLSVFGINPVLATVLLSVLAVALILAWLQIVKGDDWSGRR